MDICRILTTRQDLAGCISVPSLLLHQSMPQFVPLLNAKWILQINLMLKLKASRVNASGSLGSWIIHSSDTYLTLFNFVVEVVHSIAPGVPGLCGHKSEEQDGKNSAEGRDDDITCLPIPPHYTPSSHSWPSQYC